jgi:parallel beta-helix repeat protein
VEEIDVDRHHLDGIALFFSSDNTIRANVCDGNKGDGIRVDDGFSTGNMIEDNALKNNGEFDTYDASIGSDTAGTANTWQRNKGKRSNPLALLS